MTTAAVKQLNLHDIVPAEFIAAGNNSEWRVSGQARQEVAEFGVETRCVRSKRPI